MFRSVLLSEFAPSNWCFWAIIFAILCICVQTCGNRNLSDQAVPAGDIGPGAMLDGEGSLHHSRVQPILRLSHWKKWAELILW